MSAHGEESTIQRFTAGAAHRRDQIVSVLRFEGPDFDPLAVAQFLNSRIVGWLDQDRTSPMYSQPPGDFLNDQTSTCILNETSMAAPHHFFKSGAALPQTLIWIKHRPSPVAIVTRIYAARMTPTGRGLACRVALWFTSS